MNDYMYCIPQSSSFVHILSWSTVSHMQSREFQCSAPPLGSIHRRNLCPAKKSLLEPEKPQWNVHFAVANHSDFSGSFVSQSTLYTNFNFQKKPGVGTHLNANSANMQTHKNQQYKSFQLHVRVVVHTDAKRAKRAKAVLYLLLYPFQPGLFHHVQKNVPTACFQHRVTIFASY